MNNQYLTNWQAILQIAATALQHPFHTAQPDVSKLSSFVGVTWIYKSLQESGEAWTIKTSILKSVYAYLPPLLSTLNIYLSVVFTALSRELDPNWRQLLSAVWSEHVQSNCLIHTSDPTRCHSLGVSRRRCELGVSHSHRQYGLWCLVQVSVTVHLICTTFSEGKRMNGAWNTAGPPESATVEPLIATRKKLLSIPCELWS